MWSEIIVGGIEMEMYSNIIRLFACISLVIGAVECFAGFKIMKAMMTIWGFFIGAMLGVIVGVASQSTVLGFILVIVFGTALAILSFKLYLAGIFILTAFLTAIALYIMCENIIIAVLLAIGAGVLSIYFVKPVVIVTTSISGAGIILSSAYIMMNLGMNENSLVTVILWIPIALAGIAVQYITTQKIKNEKLGARKPLQSANSSMTFSERKYPGMQRAYRNFCIKCGYELFATTNKCPQCGYRYDD